MVVSSSFPKNEWKQFDLRYHSCKVDFFVHFLGELKIPKRLFEINWPLSTTRLKNIWVQCCLEKSAFCWLCSTSLKVWLCYCIGQKRSKLLVFFTEENLSMASKAPDTCLSKCKKLVSIYARFDFPDKTFLPLSWTRSRAKKVWQKVI